MTIGACTAAEAIARSLQQRGVKTVFALCGGHIMPIWMALAGRGIEIVDVRDERSAVYMAHSHSAITGRLGVALVTAGPGVTNAMTGIANAHMSRTSVLVISGVPPRPQEGRGALQDMAHVDLVRSITRYARTVRHAHSVLRELDAAICAASGYTGEPGPAFIDFPVDVQRETIPEALLETEHVGGAVRPAVRPRDVDVERAARLIEQSSRPLVISGRGSNGAAEAISNFLSAAGAAYLDTGETKGIISEDHPSFIGAMRGAAMKDADLVITLGRKLDFQLAYGSRAVFGKARFIRIADVAQELIDNRHGDVALLGDVAETLAALTISLSGSNLKGGRSWLKDMRRGHEERSRKLLTSLERAPVPEDGRINPNRLLGELRKRVAPDAVVIADGGDFLSLARVALSSKTYLDPGPLGCIGLATPFAIGAAKAAPGRQVIAATGDGAFGFTAIELDTAVRHKAPIMIVVSNNGSWAIEVRDQQENFGRVVGTELQFADYAGMARAFGMKAWRITQHDEIGPTLDEAFAALTNGEPVLIDAVTSPLVASSDSKSGLACVPDYQALGAWDAAERNWLGMS